MTDFIHKKIFIAAASVMGLILFLVASFFPAVMKECPAGYFTYTFGSLFGSWLTLYGFSGNETLFSLIAHNDGFSVNLLQFIYAFVMSGVYGFVICLLAGLLIKKRKTKTE